MQQLRHARRGSLRLGIDFAADFADIFEVRGTDAAAPRRAAPAGGRAPTRVTLAYTGLDDRRARDRASASSPAPDRARPPTSATFDVELAPREPPDALRRDPLRRRRRQPRPPRRAFFAGLREARRALRSLASRAASIATSNEVFNEAVRRCGLRPLHAGHRDAGGSLSLCRHPLVQHRLRPRRADHRAADAVARPAIARGVLRHLAANQATERRRRRRRRARQDPARDAPRRDGRAAARCRSAATTAASIRRRSSSCSPAPISSAPATSRPSRELWPNIEAALGWIETYGDRDGDGFVEYGRQNAEGLINQGWKDSHDSIFHADGTLASGPDRAGRGAGLCLRRLARRRRDRRAGSSDRDDAVAAMTAGPTTLRRRFDAAFFDEALGTYVLALDGDKRPCRVRTSNAGHALFTGIALPERAERGGRRR